MSQPKTNQQLIADQLHISRTTVSRCFTNHPGINPVTRAKVFQLASKLGYRHMEMRAPSKPRRVRDKTIGVLICTDRDEYLHGEYQSPGAETYAGISEFAQLHKMQIDLRYVDPADKTPNGPSYKEIEPLRNKTWDGVLLIYPFPRKVVDDLRLKFPMVALVEQYGSASYDCVDVDHHKGITLLMDQLTALGHRKIGFYTKGYEVEAGWSYRRFSAYVENVARAQRPMIWKDIVNIHPNCFATLDESYDHVAKRIQKDGVTAWICAADHQAYDLIAALKKRGIRVPHEVSITGFDGIEKPKGMPQLTTALVPRREIGFTGAKRLLDIINKRFTSTQHIFVGCEIRKGATTGAAPSPKKTRLRGDKPGKTAC